MLSEDERWPVYRYAMDLLIDEDSALAGQPLWYTGVTDGQIWIHAMAGILVNTYYR